MGDIVNRISKFASIVMIGAMVLGTTACGEFITVKETVSKGSPISEHSTTSKEGRLQNVSDAINSYYGTLEDESNYETVRQTHEKMKNASEAERERYQQALPGMEYFDTSTEGKRKAAYSYLVSTVDYIEHLRGRYEKESAPLKDVDIHIPLEAIAVYDDVAQIDVTEADIFVNGGLGDRSQFTKTQITMTRDATGAWKIIAPEQSNPIRW